MLGHIVFCLIIFILLKKNKTQFQKTHKTCATGLGPVLFVLHLNEIGVTQICAKFIFFVKFSDRNDG